MTSGLPIITVFGATGYQGGSVIDSLLETGKFAVRAVTRNPRSKLAQALKQRGVDVVQGDANDTESLGPAFKDTWGAYLVTNFWDPDMKLDPQTDYLQGKKLVDAAVAAGVKFLVWSSLHDIEKASNGELEVPHYTMKYRVEEYIKSLGIPAAFVFAGFYAQNWVNFPPFGVPTYGKDGEVYIATAVKPDTKIPVIDIEKDFGKSVSTYGGSGLIRCSGKFVSPIFLNPNQFQGQDILASTEYLTVPEMAAAFERVSGKQVNLSTVDVSTVPIAELANTIKLLNRFGYYLGLPLEPTLAKYPGVSFGSFEGWLRRSKFEPHSPN